MNSDIIDLDDLGDFLLPEDGDDDDEAQTWPILIVDDDAGVHQVTKLALRDVTVDGRSLSFVSAYSAKEARQILKDNPTFPVILLDVVMETKDAGLTLVKHIRNDLNDHLTRVILRTGQPGTTPERELIQNYEINDYKAKGELTADGLFTTVTSTVRNFVALSRVEDARKGLESVIDASASLFQMQSRDLFLGAILQQVSQILEFDSGETTSNESALLLSRPKDCPVGSSGDKGDTFNIIATLGELEGTTRHSLGGVLGEDGLAACEKAIDTKGDFQQSGNFGMVYFHNLTSHFLLVIQGKAVDDDLARTLLQTFCGNIAIALSNIVNFERITRLGEAYHRFSSSDAAPFLHKRDITEVELGDCTKIDLSVLVLDIRSFVSMSQGMSTKDLFQFINSYWAVVVPVIEQNHGVVNKYLGDGLMAIFGRENKAAQDALRCAQMLHQLTRTYNEDHRSRNSDYRLNGEYRNPLTVGIGIKSGPTICGTVGCKTRMEFTVMGDMPNFASRYQELTKVFMSGVLTDDLGDENSEYWNMSRRLPTTAVRGIVDDVQLWDFFAGDDSFSCESKMKTRGDYHRAIGQLDAGNIVEARDGLMDVLEAFPGDALVASLIASIDSNSRKYGKLCGMVD